jgi:uncharacterized membrane protein
MRDIIFYLIMAFFMLGVFFASTGWTAVIGLLFAALDFILVYFAIMRKVDKKNDKTTIL